MPGSRSSLNSPERRAAPAIGSPEPRRRLAAENRRAELIAAAQRLFAERALDEVSLEDVADAAGASRALIYHYFAGKQELYLAALRAAATELVDRVRPSETGTPRERLTAALRAYVAYAAAHATGFVALLRGGPGQAVGEVGAVVDGVRTHMLGLLASGLGAPVPSPGLRRALRSWLAVVEVSVLDWLEQADSTAEQVVTFAVDAFPALLGDSYPRRLLWPRRKHR